MVGRVSSQLKPSEIYILSCGKGLYSILAICFISRSNKVIVFLIILIFSIIFKRSHENVLQYKNFGLTQYFKPFNKNIMRNIQKMFLMYFLKIICRYYKNVLKTFFNDLFI